MPDIDHHRDRAYAETAFPAHGEFTVTETPAGLEVTGNCPACGGLTVMMFDYGPPDGVKGVFRRRDAGHSQRAAGPRTVTIYCECGHVHAERPEGALDRGCGAFWKVEIPS